jgi:hypothetical protein
MPALGEGIESEAPFLSEFPQKPARMESVDVSEKFW